jgi:hypothetical protein
MTILTLTETTQSISTYPNAENPNPFFCVKLVVLTTTSLSRTYTKTPKTFERWRLVTIMGGTRVLCALTLLSTVFTT